MSGNFAVCVKGHRHSTGHLAALCDAGQPVPATAPEELPRAMDLLADIFDCSWREADCAKCLRRVNGALREAEAAALEVAAKAAEQTAWNCKDAAPATHVLDHAAHSSAHDACHESIEAGARIRALIPAEAA